jgi:hypothetical protein
VVLASAGQGLCLKERERMAVGILELDGPAPRRLCNGRQQLHAAGDERLGHRVNPSFVEAEQAVRKISR